MDEVSFDTFHANAENIYRVEMDMHDSDGIRHTLLTSFPLGGALQGNIPEVQKATRSYNLRNLLIRYEDKVFVEDDITAVDPTFLNIFTFPLKSGDPENALNQTNSILITEEMAEKYFGAEDPLGKVMTIDNEFDFTVTGVLEDVPTNSTLQFTLLVPLEFLRTLGTYYDYWRSLNCVTWVELHPDAPVSSIGHKIGEVLEKNDPSSTLRWEFSLMSLTDINLHGYANAFFEISGKIKSVNIFRILAVSVLVIACINFMNLSTARSTKRALEVGLKKVVGADRKQIIAQFFGESVLTALIAFMFAWILFSAFLPVFNTLSAKAFTMNSVLTLKFVIMFLSVALITGIISGIYPAVYLSSFRPVQVLTGKSRSSTENGRFRKCMVVTQFCLSIIAIIGTVVVYQQLQYMRTKNLGYNKEQLVYLPLRGEARQSYPVLKDQLSKSPEIVIVSGARQRPTLFGSKMSGVEWDGKDPENRVSLSYTTVDYDFVETMGIDLLEGRSFSRAFASDATTSILVNEEVQKLLGGSSVIGKRLSAFGIDGRIIGVTKNFHFQSVKNSIGPLMMYARPEMVEFAIVRLRPGDIAASLNRIKSLWMRLFPAYPFEYVFIDDDFAEAFGTDQRMSAVLKYATVMTIFIACLGLFGLAAFMAEKRTKEIGIRKTLGASVSGVTVMLTTEFVKWVMLSNIIAIPVAYFIMNRWLQDYPYPVTMKWWVFGLALTSSVAVALTTVIYQSLRAAFRNPVDSLKYE